MKKLSKSCQQLIENFLQLKSAEWTTFTPHHPLTNFADPIANFLRDQFVAIKEDSLILPPHSPSNSEPRIIHFCIYEKIPCILNTSLTRGNVFLVGLRMPPWNS